MMPVGTEHHANPDAGIDGIGTSGRTGRCRLRHVINDALGYARLLQIIDVGRREIINGTLVADIADDHSIIDTGMPQSSNIRDAEWVSMNHLIVNGGRNAASLDGVIIGLLPGCGCAGYQQQGKCRDADCASPCLG